ncbi:hypothetical protein DL93DRAFT_411534 [Clavulina sp. PMI_390]|nr:hypothetical protein DL93DRAFT_411534 [Clavulina sp. PMI_390]
MPALSSACVRCRDSKQKCDGLKPTCSRCQHHHRECVYPAKRVNRRASVLETLEARALQLETNLHRLALTSTHDLQLASTKLLDRIGHLDDVDIIRPAQRSVTVDTAWLPIFPYPQQGEAGPSRGQILSQDSTEGYTSVVSRAMVELQVTSHSWARLDEPHVPPLLSLQLIKLFLPYRSHYYFFMDVSHFLHCASLPTSDPDSIHPCLLNACYLAGCSSSGGILASLEPYFVKRTRYFLDQALMFADRITHFLWASLVLGCYFIRTRRLEECFTVASAASRFAIACGLVLPLDPRTIVTNDFGTTGFLLPEPRNEVEAVDRIRLAQSIYLMDITTPILGGAPSSFPYDARWELGPKEASLAYPYGKGSLISEERLSNLWRSELYLKVSMARTLDRVTTFARLACVIGKRGSDAEYMVLSAHLDFQQSNIPPLSDTRGLQPMEGVSTFNPNMLLAHMMLYGSGLVLHNLPAERDMGAKGRLIHCVRALVNVCEKVRGTKRLHRVQAGMMNGIHMMNAVRVVAHELRQNGAQRENIRLLINDCYVIELFLDFIDDLILFNPAWTGTTALVKDLLMDAVTPLVA